MKRSTGLGQEKDVVTTCVQRNHNKYLFFVSDGKNSLLSYRPRLTCDRGLRGLGGGEELEEKDDRLSVSPSPSPKSNKRKLRN